jgi:membrane-associated PAP2 superfamily phosphatase
MTATQAGYIKKVLLHAAIFAALTLPFYFFNLDMKIESWFFNLNAFKWYSSENPFFTFIYKYGTIPGAMLAALAITAFSVSFISKNWVKYRKPAALIILTFLLGPGLFINVICKNYTGRPRPREVKEFGGRWDFKQPFEFGTPGRGFSFPCGHASMGFVFYAVYLAYRRKKPKTSAAFLSAAFISGGLLGFARMAQGAHFASDVLWSAGFTILAAEAVHYFVVHTSDDDRELFGGVKNMNTGFAVLSISMIFIAAAFFMFATPFNRFRRYNLGCAASFSAKTDNASFNITAQKTGEAGTLDFSAAGFGLPWADLEDDLKNTGGDYIYYNNEKSIFSELNSSVVLKAPQCAYKEFTVMTKKGDINFRGPSGKTDRLSLYTAGGDISLSLAEAGRVKTIYIKTLNGNIVFMADNKFKFPENSVIDLSAVNGSVRIISAAADFDDLDKNVKKLDGSKELHLKPRLKGGLEININAKDIEIGEK